MGTVIITLRVFPESIEIDLSNLVANIKEIIKQLGGNYESFEEVPIAFGLKALDIKFTYPDKEFKEEELIEKIKNISGVSDAEVVRTTLSSI